MYILTLNALPHLAVSKVVVHNLMIHGPHNIQVSFDQQEEDMHRQLGLLRLCEGVHPLSAL